MHLVFGQRALHQTVIARPAAGACCVICKHSGVRLGSVDVTACSERAAAACVVVLDHPLCVGVLGPIARSVHRVPWAPWLAVDLANVQSQPASPCGPHKYANARVTSTRRRTVKVPTGRRLSEWELGTHRIRSTEHDWAPSLQHHAPDFAQCHQSVSYASARK